MKAQEKLTDEALAEYQAKVWQSLQKLRTDDNIKVVELVRDDCTEAMLDVLETIE